MHNAPQKPIFKTFPPTQSELSGHAPTPVLKMGFCCATGFSVVETLVYLAIVATALTLIVGTALGLSRAYGGAANLARIERDAVSALERITREARAGAAVDGVGSTLVLSMDNGGTREFFVSGGALHMKENGVDQGSLTGSAVAASSFVVRLITTGRSEAVKIELALQSGSGTASTTKRFYATTILRNSY